MDDETVTDVIPAKTVREKNFMIAELKSDIFIIPTLDKTSIIYSPLRGAAFYANPEATKVVKEFIESGILPPKDNEISVSGYLHKLSQIKVEIPKQESIHSHSSDAVFILSQICNLACSYCYAQNSRSKEILSLEKIKTVVDFVCADTNHKNKSFSFIGGGEPLVTWDIFKRSVNYIQTVTEKKGFSTKIKVTTNGTLLNKERISFLKTNNIIIGISFDILPIIQDTQRPFPNRGVSSFREVHSNIRMLLSNGLIPRIRSTITSQNVSLMPQMVEFVIEKYPEIKSLHFEPVTDISDNSDSFYQQYFVFFAKAMKIAQKYGIYLNNSIIHSFKRIRTRFCHGEFCVTPNSCIVSCHRISSDRDTYFKSFKYGKITDKIELETEGLNRTFDIFEKKTMHCSDCCAKWHCAGGCTMYRVTSTEKELHSYCALVRNMLSCFLAKKLGRIAIIKLDKPF